MGAGTASRVATTDAPVHGGSAVTSARGIVLLAVILGLVLVAGCLVGTEDPSQAAEPASEDGNATDLSRTVDDDLLVPADRLHAWQARTDEFGTPPGNRPTGSIAAHGYIDALHNELTTILGPDQVDKEAFTFPKWEEPAPSNVSLEIQEADEPREIPLAAYIPYSGMTPADGIEAPMVYVGADAEARSIGAADVEGKIAVVDVPPVPLTTGVFEAIAYYEHDPNDTVDPTTRYDRSWVSQIPLLEMMRELEEAGAVGIVAVLDLPEEMANGAYFPYEGEVVGLPGVFVDAETGRALKQAASPDGVDARLVLETRMDEEATSYNLIATIPGRSDETILLQSHTDGPNSIEDNGPWAAVALAAYFQQVPREERERTIQIVLTDGHFAGGFGGGVGAWRFVEAHEDDILADTVAAISLEHLGAREHIPVDDGGYGLTGLNEMAAFFVPENEPLVEASIDMAKREDLARHLVLRPFEPNEEDPTKRLWPGEGMVFHSVGIPTIQFITGPTYLLNADQPTTDRFTDYELMWRQVRGFAQLVIDLSHVPAHELAEQDPTTVGEPTSIVPGPPAMEEAGSAGSLELLPFDRLRARLDR